MHSAEPRLLAVAVYGDGAHLSHIHGALSCLMLVCMVTCNVTGKWCSCWLLHRAQRCMPLSLLVRGSGCACVERCVACVGSCTRTQPAGRAHEGYLVLPRNGMLRRR
jgi:hypothetical protein